MGWLFTPERHVFLLAKIKNSTSKTSSVNDGFSQTAKLTQDCKKNFHTCYRLRVSREKWLERASQRKKMSPMDILVTAFNTVILVGSYHSLKLFSTIQKNLIILQTQKTKDWSEDCQHLQTQL